jgi:hypothetical protein
MSKQIKKRVLIPLKWKICTEGITEANYLHKYVDALGIREHIDINCPKAKEKGCGRQHEALLDKMQECGRTWQYEKIFLVHDYDKAVENSKEKESFNETLRRAEPESNIYVIYANPCFEYWLFLHTEYTDSDLHRHGFQEKFKDICNKKRGLAGKPPLHGDDYKSDPDLFDYLNGLEGVAEACRKAKKRFENEVPPFSKIHYAKNAPCTNMFELINALQIYKENLAP